MEEKLVVAVDVINMKLLSVTLMVLVSLLGFSQVKDNQSTFKKRFRKSPIKRTKRRGLLRNVAVALGNWAHESAIPALSLGLQDSEPLVRSHAAWALGRISASQAKINLKAAKITEKGMKTAFEVINPGVRQCDAVGEIQKALFKGTPEFGGDYASIATLLPTGKGTSASHLTATEDKFVLGEATIIEIAGAYKRYHCPMARTILLGEKDQKKIDTMKATNEALDAGIAATRPGNTADDIAQKFWGVLDKYGIKKESRTGYSIGIGYPPDWGEQTLNISKGDKTVLQPNVTFHMIAVMQFGEWGVEASESVRVTEKGSELFCNLSRELHIKG